MELSRPEMASVSGGVMFLHAVWRFCLMFFASAGIGVIFGIVSTMISLLSSQFLLSLTRSVTKMYATASLLVLVSSGFTNQITESLSGPLRPDPWHSRIFVEYGPRVDRHRSIASQ